MRKHPSWTTSGCRSAFISFRTCGLVVASSVHVSICSNLYTDPQFITFTFWHLLPSREMSFTFLPSAFLYLFLWVFSYLTRSLCPGQGVSSTKVLLGLHGSSPYLSLLIPGLLGRWQRLQMAAWWANCGASLALAQAWMTGSGPKAPDFSLSLRHHWRSQAGLRGSEGLL